MGEVMNLKITLFAISTLLITAANKEQLKSTDHFNRGPASEVVKEQKVESTEPKVENKKDEKSELANLLCLAKNEATKLSEEVKKLLKDKEEVVAEVNKLKKDKEELKNKKETKKSIDPDKKSKGLDKKMTKNTRKVAAKQDSLSKKVDEMKDEK